MKKEEYGTKYVEHLIEQYKSFVEMKKGFLERKVQKDKFYSSILLGFLAFLIYMFRDADFNIMLYFIFIIASITGLLLCYVWYKILSFYRMRSDAHYYILKEMEKFLPFECYRLEKQEIDDMVKNFDAITKIEMDVPWIIAIPYIILLIYSTIKLIIEIRML